MRSVVRAFLFNPDGHILMARHRLNTPWVLPGGHVEVDESLHEAMQREISEEFGILATFFETDPDEILYHRGKPLEHFPTPITSYALSYKNQEGIDKSRIEYIFLMETDEVIKKIQDQEIYEYKWFNPEEILSMKPNIDTWDFIIEMLEKIMDEGEEE